MENHSDQSSRSKGGLPLDENGEPIRKKKRVPTDKNGEPIRRKKPPLDENGEPIRRRKPPVDENGEPIRRRRPLTDENGEPIRRRKPQADEIDEHIRPIRPRTQPHGDNIGPIRRRKPPVDENGEPIRRRRPPTDENGEPIRRRRPPTDENGEPIRRRRPPADEYGGHKRPVGKSRKRQGDKIMNSEEKTKKPNNHNQKKRPKENSEKNSSRGCLFPIFLLLICVVIFVASFTILAGFMSEHSFDDLLAMAKGEAIVESETEETTDNSSYIDSSSLLSQVENQLYNSEREGVISQISLGSNTMTVYDTGNKSTVLLNFNNSTEFKDENGSTISITKINEGDPVIFVYDEDKKLLSLQLNPDAEEITSLAVTVNTSRKLITIGSDVFKYNDNTVFRYNDGVLNPKDITEYDIVTVKAVGYDAWGVIMEKSHGILKFTNYEIIPDAAYSVDEGGFNTIPEEGFIYLTEGVHTVTVQSSGISDYVSKLVIKADEEAELNLAAVQFLRGSLVVDTSTTGAALYVDGVQKSIRNPMFLNYGSHKVTLTKQGKSTTEYVNINKEHTEIYMNVK